MKYKKFETEVTSKTMAASLEKKVKKLGGRFIAMKNYKNAGIFHDASAIFVFEIPSKNADKFSL